MNNKNLPVMILAVAIIVAIALYAFVSNVSKPKALVISSDEQLQALNAPAPSGSFSLPQVKWLANGKPDLSGPIEYKVSFGGSADGPTISKIVFAPYDVNPGDAQDIYVVGEYAGGVSGVTASIKTDKGVMPLQLTLAQGDAKSGVWKGSWTAKDVHPGYYTVDFTAASADGKSRGTSAAFLDGLLSDIFATPVYADYGLEQCGIPIAGAAIIGSCTLTAGSDAVVNGNVTIGNLGYINIPAASSSITFGFSNGYSIIFCPGGSCSISIASGGKIVKMGVGGTPYNSYVEDKDGDKYWDAQTVATSNPYGAGGYVRSVSFSGGGDCNDVSSSVWRSLAGYTDADKDNHGVGTAQQVCSGASLPLGYSLNNDDCNDSNINVNPGAWFFTTATTTNMNLTTHAYDGGGEVNFDYNCNGYEVVDGSYVGQQYYSTCQKINCNYGGSPCQDADCQPAVLKNYPSTCGASYKEYGSGENECSSNCLNPTAENSQYCVSAGYDVLCNPSACTYATACNMTWFSYIPCN